MPIGTLFVSPEWHATEEGERALQSINHRQCNMRKPFYFLERPLLPEPYPDVFEYKLFLSGKSMVGKSFLAAQLSATPLHNSQYQETIGINKYLIYWPTRIEEVGKMVLFKLNVWDASERGLQNFEHLTGALMDEADGVIFVFSFADKSSLTELPHRITRVQNDCEARKTSRSGSSAVKPCSLIFGTKLDLQTEVEVTLSEVTDFESNWSQKVLTLGGVHPTLGAQTDPFLQPVTSYSSRGSSLETAEQHTAVALNYMCDQLWIRDQMQAGNMSLQQR